MRYNLKLYRIFLPWLQVSSTQSNLSFEFFYFCIFKRYLHQISISSNLTRLISESSVPFIVVCISLKNEISPSIKNTEIQDFFYTFISKNGKKIVHSIVIWRKYIRNINIFIECYFYFIACLTRKIIFYSNFVFS